MINQLYFCMQEQVDGVVWWLKESFPRVLKVFESIYRWLKPDTKYYKIDKFLLFHQVYILETMHGMFHLHLVGFFYYM